MTSYHVDLPDQVRVDLFDSSEACLFAQERAYRLVHSYR